jgi:hypothetical protein
MKRERAPATQRRRMAYPLPPRAALNAIDLQWQNLANAAHVQH